MSPRMKQWEKLRRRLERETEPQRRDGVKLDMALLEEEIAYYEPQDEC